MLRKRYAFTIAEPILLEFKANLAESGLSPHATSILIQQYMEQFNAEYSKKGTTEQLQLFKV